MDVRCVFWPAVRHATEALRAVVGSFDAADLVPSEASRELGRSCRTVNL